MRTLRILLVAALAGLISAGWLSHGFSAFDDGAYVWGLRELQSGKVLHRDFAFAHPGYVLWVLLPFSAFLEQDILHYRYPLPLLAALVAAAVAWLLRYRGTLAMFAGGAAVSALGFVQFATYSASWFAVTAMVLCVAMLWSGCEAQPSGRSRWLLLLAGLMAGVAFGFRAPNGVAAVMAALLLLSQHALRQEAAAGTRVFNVVGVAVMGLAAAGIALLADNLERIVTLLPPFLACVAMAIRLFRGGAIGFPRSIAWFSAGFVIAILPLLAWAVTNSALEAMLRDMIFVPGAISDSNRDYGATGSHGLLTELMVIGTGPVAWIDLLNAGIYLFALAFPLLLLAMYPRGNSEFRPLWVLAAFSCIGIAVLPQLIYAFYVWPFVAAAWLEQVRRPRPAAMVLLATCGLFLFVSPRGLYPGSHGLQPDRLWAALESSDGSWEAMVCPLERCSVKADPRALTVFASDVQTLRDSVDPSEPLLVLESFAAYAHFLANPAPFTLGRSDNKGTYEQTRDYRQAFMADAELVVAVPKEDRHKYTGLLQDYCVVREMGRWQFLKRCLAPH